MIFCFKEFFYSYFVYPDKKLPALYEEKAGNSDLFIQL